MKKMEIEFERGGKFVAELLEDAAPETSTAVWNNLPIEKKIYHVVWSGRCIYVEVDFRVEKVENPFRHFDPGEIVFNTHNICSGPVNDPYRDEILIVYGDRNFLTDTMGIPSYPNRFAKIVEGDLKELAAIGPRIREKGVEKVIFRKKT